MRKKTSGDLGGVQSELKQLLAHCQARHAEPAGGSCLVAVGLPDGLGKELAPRFMDHFRADIGGFTTLDDLELPPGGMLRLDDQPAHEHDSGGKASQPSARGLLHCLLTS